MTNLPYVLAAAFGIGLLIFIHELGHFLMARRIGVRVEVFSLGFGPRLLGFQRGGTDYRLSLVPLGGYVAVAGQDPSDRRYPPDECLYSKSLPGRFWFWSGGVIMNLLFALVAFPIVFGQGVEFVAPRIGGVVPGGTAWEAGLEHGDRVRSLDGKAMYSFYNLETEVALGGAKARTLEIESGDEVETVEVTPTYDRERGIYSLGIRSSVRDEFPEVRVRPDGPAARAGMRTGDRLVAIGGESARGDAVLDALSTHPLPPGATPEPVEVSYQRDGERHRVTLTPAAVDSDTPRLGVVRGQRRVVGLRPGLAPVLRALDLRVGDHVVAVDGEPFAGETFDPTAADGERITLRVRREDGTMAGLQAPITAGEREALGEAVALGPDTWQIHLIPQAGTPAARAGIGHGDRLLAVDGRRVERWEELVDVVTGAAGQPVTLRLEPLGGGEAYSVTVEPSPLVADYGFVPRLREATRLYQKDGFGPALQAGMVASVDLIKQLYVTLKRLFTGDVAAKNLGGIITISRVSYRFAQWGPSRFFYFLALLSLNLAFINVLPIPVLDGGHLMFLLIERIKGSPVSTRVFTYSQVLGLIFVLALILFVTYNDILRLL